MNAHSTLWYSHTDDHRGQLISDIISNSEHILNTDTPTRVPHTTLHHTRTKLRPPSHNHNNQHTHQIQNYNKTDTHSQTIGKQTGHRSLQTPRLVYRTFTHNLHQTYILQTPFSQTSSSTIPHISTQHGFKSNHSTSTALHNINNTIATGFNQNNPERTITVALYIYYRFIVHFPIGLDFHFLLSWTSSLSISGSDICASTLSNHVFLGLPTGLLPSTLYSIHFSPSSHHMSIPYQSTTSNESCARLNSNQPSQFLICPSVFQ